MSLQTNASFAVFLNLRCSTGTRRSGDIDSQYYQSVQQADWCMPVDDTEMRWYGAYMIVPRDRGEQGVWRTRV